MDTYQILTLLFVAGNFLLDFIIFIKLLLDGDIKK